MHVFQELVVVRLCVLIAINYILIWSIEQETQSRQSAPIKNGAAGHSSFPFTVSLRYKPTRSHFCGGSIISSTKVLTAAHCMVGQNPSLVDVAAGQLYKSSDSGDYEQIRDVSYMLVINIHFISWSKQLVYQ